MSAIKVMNPATDELVLEIESMWKGGTDVFLVQFL